MAVILTMPAWLAASRWGWFLPCIYLVLHFILYTRLVRRHGPALNPLLGMTAILMLLYTIAFMATLIV